MGCTYLARAQEGMESCSCWPDDYRSASFPDLFRARTFVPFNPTPDYDKWPFVWMWRAAMLKQEWYEQHCGPDATVYVRFLRGAFYWMLLVACTVFPTLLALNWTYSPASISHDSIDRAWLSSIALSIPGNHLLYVHVVCVWFLTLTWMATLAWIGYGVARIRRNVLRALLRADANSHTDAPQRPPEDVGWMFRSVLIRNIPEAMRSEEAIRQ